MGSAEMVPAGSGNMEASAPARFFVDAAAHDYPLVPGSPAIDAGVALPTVTGGRLGTPRPTGQHWDTGAFEFRPKQHRLPPGRHAVKGPTQDGHYLGSRMQNGEHRQLLVLQLEAQVPGVEIGGALHV